MLLFRNDAGNWLSAAGGGDENHVVNPLAINQDGCWSE